VAPLLNSSRTAIHSAAGGLGQLMTRWARHLGATVIGTAGSDGKLDPADYARTVKTLLTGGSDPVISKEPAGAFTNAVIDKAMAK